MIDARTSGYPTLTGIATALFIVGCTPSPNPPSAEDRLTAQATAAVRDTLRDPGSAQFKDVNAHVIGKCASGSVNAKNAFGGYTGFTEFIYVDKKVVLNDQGPSGSTAYYRAQADCTRESIDRNDLKSPDPMIRKFTQMNIDAADKELASRPALDKRLAEAEARVAQTQP